MPKKPNSHGQDQEYVPAGNGDASGEYADEKGSNWHFENFGSPKKTTSKIDIVKSDIYGKTNVYVDNKLILRDLSDEEADELRRVYEKENLEQLQHNIANMFAKQAVVAFGTVFNEKELTEIEAQTKRLNSDFKNIK